ncbi:MAG: FAD-binding and (Fe-S)-binding domain-containing protein [Bacteroidota bacterium]
MMKITSFEQQLKDIIRGEVLFDKGTRAAYSTDSSNYRQVPVGVVVPREITDVIEAISIARNNNIPILNRGGGTSLAGQCCNAALVLDMSKYLREIIELDPVKSIARIQPGLILDTLRDAAEKHHLTFGPDPATHNHCTLGGMIGNNSCGVHSVMSGKTDNNIHELEILTYRGNRFKVGATTEAGLEAIINASGPKGEIFSKLKSLRDKYAELIRQKFPKIPRCVSGYNLPALLPENGFHVGRSLVGSEGTCVTVLEALVKLVNSPAGRSLVVLGYPDIFSAADHITEIMEHQPIALEAFDDFMVQGMYKKNLHTDKLPLLPEGGGWLLIEFGGENKLDADERAQKFITMLGSKINHPVIKQFTDKIEASKVWKIRESALGAVSNVPGQRHSWEGWEDSAVPPYVMGKYLRDLKKLYDKYSYEGAFYGHLGEGCVHTRITFDLESSDGIKKFRSFIHEAADLVVGYGGSFSGEHGDGQSRGELLPKMFGNELMEAFREFKAIWDPDGKMNPGKLIDAYRIDENLRFSDHFKPIPVETNFSFHSDDKNFSHAARRCVGVGDCRREHGGTMCPSFRVTGDERHSTRGRARLLFEMMRGDLISDGWKSDEVKEALDLCLSCKACKVECPVNVDMATYKAEFLSHYYAKRMKPIAAYSMGLIHRWARIGSLFPRLTNIFTGAFSNGALIKKMAGIAAERSIPKFSTTTFRTWFDDNHRKTPEQLLPSLDKKKTALDLVEKPFHPTGSATMRSEIAQSSSHRVILWADTFNNHFHAQVAVAATETLEYLGYQVMIPPKHLCCGRPLFDYGMLTLAKKLLSETLSTLKPWLDEGLPIIVLEPSCLAVFKDELINFFPDRKDAQQLRDNSCTLAQFLQMHVKNYSVPLLHKKAVLQTHCHEKATHPTNYELDVLRRLGLDVQLLDAGCCGMAGSFGFRKEHYPVSMQIAELELFPIIRSLEDDTLIIADGFSCMEQITQGTGRRVYHLAEVFRMSLKGL